MAHLHSISHVTLYNSTYFAVFGDNTWSSQGLPISLTNKIERVQSYIEFFSLGPCHQWFCRLKNSEVSYKIHDSYFKKILKNSTIQPYKIWFNGNNGYVLQFEDLNIIWNNIPYDLQMTLKTRPKSSSKLQHLTFGPENTWWISFHDNHSICSNNLPAHIKQHLHLHEIKYLVLDPMTSENHFICQTNGLHIWCGKYNQFNRISNETTNNNIICLNPKMIRYTQTTISHRFSDGSYLDELRQELDNGMTEVDGVPIIDVIQTRSGKFWSLNNRRLWCFRNASHVDQIPVRIVQQRPYWFNKRVRQLTNPFNVHIRYSPDVAEEKFDSTGDITLAFRNYSYIFSDL